MDLRTAELSVVVVAHVVIVILRTECSLATVAPPTAVLKDLRLRSLPVPSLRAVLSLPLFTEYLPVLTLHRRTLEALTSAFFANDLPLLAAFFAKDLTILLLSREIRPGLLETLLANLLFLTSL
jgi:hypothetical protein